MISCPNTLLFFLLIVLYCCLDCVLSEPVIFPVDCDDGINDVDRAKIYFLPPTTIPSLTNGNLSVYVVNSDCYKCAWKFMSNFTMDTQCYFMWTPFSWTMYLVNSTDSNNLITLQSQDYLFGDHGEYSFTTDGQILSINETKTPIDSLEALYILIGLLSGVTVLSYLLPYLYNKYQEAHAEDMYLASSGKTNIPFDHGHHAHEPLLPTTSSEASRTLTTPPTPLPVSSTSTKKKKQRLQSLDTFRGFALLLMIFVNYGGGGYWFFDHAAWNGLTLADCLFPWFVWIMGVSMALNFSTATLLPPPPPGTHTTSVVDYLLLFCTSSEVYFTTYRSVWAKVVVRTAKLFGLGMFLANGYEYTTWRVPGVLQYFALAYCANAAILLICYPAANEEVRRLEQEEQLNGNGNTGKEVTNITGMVSGTNTDETATTGNPLTGNTDTDNNTELPNGKHTGKIPLRYQVSLPVSDLVRVQQWYGWSDLPWSRIWYAYRYEYLVQVGILLVFLVVCLGIPAPGCPVGYNGPGGLSGYPETQFCTGGIHRYIDLSTFGYWFIYHHPTCKELYECRVYDPEGLLGTLSTITLTYLGILCGRGIVYYHHTVDRLCLWFGQAFVYLLIAGILCNFSQNEGIIPVNKNLWSTSFVLVTAGFGTLGFILCYLLVDVYKVWSGKPFLYLGMNSILFYMSHQLLANYMPFSYMLYHTSHKSLLLMHCVGVLSWVIIAYYFYTIKFFVKV